MRASNLIIAVIVLASIVGCASSGHPTESGLEDWLNVCRTAKTQYLSEGSSADVTFSPLSITNTEGSYWAIDWYGIKIPIPPVKYSSVGIRNGSKDLKSIYLTSDDGKFSLILTYKSIPNWTIQDSQKSIRGIIDTSSLTLENLIDYSYTVTSKDLNCKAGANIYTEAIVYTALMIKEINSHGTLNSAHRGIAGKKGWLTRSSVRDKIIWSAEMPVGTIKNTFVTVEYLVNEHSKYSAIGALINQPNLRLIDDPAWLHNFQMIATTWDKPGLIKLAKDNNYRFTDFDGLPSAQVIMKRLNESRSNNAN